MRPLDELSVARARHLQGIVFDLDDTLLTAGELTLEAYEALHQLHRAGLQLVACTGRPAAWGEVIARQWPLVLAVTENGAVSVRRQGSTVALLDRVPPPDRERRQRRLERLAAELAQAFPAIERADDNRGRLTDVTFDIGERCRLPATQVAALRRAALARGAGTFLSTIHLHVTFDRDDKATGTLFALAAAGGIDPSAALHRFAFVGDSANDAACFAAFRTTFGVANVADQLGALTLAPRYVSPGKAGAGFAQIAARILALRSSR